LERIEFESSKLLDTIGKLRKQIPSTEYDPSKSVSTIKMKKRHHESGIFNKNVYYFLVLVRPSTIEDFGQVCLRNLIVLLPTGFL
jgi:hypothetical protein